MGRIGPMEIMIIAGIALLIFGPRQLPKMGRAIGETIREMRNIGKAATEAKDDLDATVRDIKRPL